jgi:hypothetical protein
MTSEDRALEVISRFACKKDDDIENFLYNKALLFDRKGKSKTHLLLDERLLQNGTIEAVAYFSLAIQLLRIPEGTSNNQIRKLDGLYSRKGITPITEIPSFLIGQLAKNDRYSKLFSGSLLLEYALSAVATAERIVGGRIVFVECREIPVLINFYRNNGFFVFSQRS